MQMLSGVSVIGRTRSPVLPHFLRLPSLQLPFLTGLRWGTGWGENGYVRMSKQPWVGGPSGLYWQGIYSASRPVVKNGEPCVVHLVGGGMLWVVAHSCCLASCCLCM